MKTVFLFRHALATHNLDGYGNQILSASILPEGIPPIERLAAFLREIPTETNVVSPVQRCQQTAAIITQGSGKVFTIDPRLTEFAGERPDETFPELAARCQDFLGDVQKNNDQSILICSHGAVIATLKYLILTGHFDEGEQYDYPATGELWILHDRKLEALDFN